jgi:O-6-methylguanine DNA methyltransferase
MLVCTPYFVVGTYLGSGFINGQTISSKSLLETSLEAGLSGASRLHDLFVTFDAMTSGDFKKQGAGLEIEYSFSDSPFGECLVATTKRGLCHFGRDIALYIGRPKASRAVAGAIAVNPVAYLIPCHRVITKSGKIHKYRWESLRKKAIIGWEAAQNE